jgi:hypothetical protein
VATPKFTLNLPTKAKRTAVRGLPPLDLVQVNLDKPTEPRVYEVQRKGTTSAFLIAPLYQLLLIYYEVLSFFVYYLIY